MQLDFPLHPKQLKAFLTEATEVFYGGATRGGKAVALDTEIATPSGFIQMRDVQPGQQVIGADGVGAAVVAVSEIFEQPSYELTFDTGEKIIAGENHEWITETARERANNAKRNPQYREARKLSRPTRGTGKRPDLALANALRKSQLKTPQGTIRTTKEIAETLYSNDGRLNHSVALCEPWKLISRDLLVDPYVLGVWLGDGSKGCGDYTSADAEIADHIKAAGYKVKKGKRYRYCVLGLRKRLRDLQVLRSKHVPHDYLFASEQQRLELLRGLMDTDGYCDGEDGRVQFCNTNKNLSDAVAFLANSLGCKVFRKTKQPKCSSKTCLPAYLVEWTSTLQCFKLKRKLARLPKKIKPKKRFIVSCTEVGLRQVKCLQVANDSHTYLVTRSGIQTHNSHLMRVVFITFCTWIPGLQAFLFRKVYDDVIQNHMEGPSGFRAMLAPLAQEGHVRITENQVRWTKTGSLITLDHLGSDDVLDKHQGVPKHLLGIEEVCQIPERRIRFLRAWVTMPEAMKEALPDRLQGMFPRILYTGNPIGVSAPYFRRNFVKAATPGTIFKAPDDDGGFLRQYIEARVEDNPSEDAAAVRRRVLGLGNDAESRALLESDWDAPIGEFFTMYREDKHVTPSLKPPAHWFKFRTFDWGSAEPACCLWWCVSDGVSFRDSLGRERWFPAGALIAYREWYICNERAPSKGLELSNEEMADGIRERTEEPDCVLTVTDSKPFQGVGMKKGGTKYTPADIFREHGVPLQLGNCARVHGWSQLRDRLIGVDGFPMFYLSEDCYYTRDYLPAIGHHKTRPEDAEESGEATHASDCCRLAATTRPVVQKAPDVRPARQRGESISPIDIIVTLQKGNGDGRHSQQFKRY